MTVPVTGITPIYGIEYLVPGEPARNTRAKMERNAKQIEAALAAGPASPPGAADLLVVSGRVSDIENRHNVYTFSPDSAAGTTEFAVAQVTQATVPGKRYRIRLQLAIVGSVVGDRVFVQIRKGVGITGTIIQSGNYLTPSPAGTAFTVTLTAFDTPAAGTSSSTWTVTLQRFGTGTVRTEADSPGPAFAEVERMQ